MAKWWLAVIVVIGLVAGAVWVTRSDDTVVAGITERTDCHLTGREGWPDIPPLEPTPAVGEVPPTQAQDVFGLDRLNDPMNELQGLVTGLDFTDEAGYDSFDWGPDYAGLVGDPATGQAVLLLTVGSTFATEPLYALFPKGADDLRIEYVPYSFEQLDTWKDSLRGPLRSLDVNDIGWSVNERMNRIDIETTEPDRVDLTGLLPADAYCLVKLDGAEQGPLTATVGDLELRILTATVTDIPSEVRALPTELTALDGIDIATVLRRGCTAWSFTPFRDHGAINDAVYLFLTSANDASMFDQPVVEDLDVLDDAIAEACIYRDDPPLAWTVLSDRLGVTDEEFTALVDASCANYARSEPHKSPQAGFDRFIFEVVGVGDLEALIEQLCSE